MKHADSECVCVESWFQGPAEKVRVRRGGLHGARESGINDLGENKRETGLIMRIMPETRDGSLLDYRVPSKPEFQGQP